MKCRLQQTRQEKTLNEYYDHAAKIMRNWPNWEPQETETPTFSTTKVLDVSGQVTKTQTQPESKRH